MLSHIVLKLWAKKQAFMAQENGATAIEYGLIAAGIAVAISAVVFTFGEDLAELFRNMSGKVSGAAAK